MQHTRAKEKRKSSTLGVSLASLGVSQRWYFCCVLTSFAVPALCYSFSLDEVCELSCLLFFDPEPGGDLTHAVNLISALGVSIFR